MATNLIDTARSLITPDVISRISSIIGREVLVLYLKRPCLNCRSMLGAGVGCFGYTDLKEAARYRGGLWVLNGVEESLGDAGVMVLDCDGKWAERWHWFVLR